MSSGAHIVLPCFLSQFLAFFTCFSLASAVGSCPRSPRWLSFSCYGMFIISQAIKLQQRVCEGMYAEHGTRGGTVLVYTFKVCTTSTS